MIELALELLWRNALAVIPLALAVAAMTRLVPSRPSTRHALWVAALIGFLAPPLLPGMARFGPPTAAEVAERAAVTPVQLAHDERSKAAPTEPLDQRDAVERQIVETPQYVPPARVLLTPRLGAGESTTGVRSSLDRPRGGDTGAIWPSTTSARRTPATTPIPPALRTAPARATTPGPSASDASTPDASPTTIVDSSPLSDEAATSIDETRSSHATTAGAATDGAMASPLAWATDWQVTLLALREALVAMPHIPTHVWLIGAGVALAIGCGRSLWFRRLLSKGEPAPRDIETMVAGASARLGLRRTPETVLVDDCITPMVWCGRRARLVLPRSLWSELDEVGRAAVVHHELAHLKRKDHWICWAEALVGLLYWWHPVAWWVRRRIREEADLCCDAWVTALLPQHRRAYAQALVSTRQYISEHGSATPAVGLGVMSNRGRRFARRLLMIMTHSQKPSLSTMGRMLALGVAGAGILASPVLACPPDKEKKKEKQKQVEPAEPERSTFEEFMDPREEQAAQASAERQARLDALRAQLASHQAEAEAAAASGECDSNRAEREEKIAALRHELAQVTEARAAYAQASSPALVYVQDGGQGVSSFEQWAQGETFERTYTLSDPKKLEKLTTLLIRDDVPLLVRPHDDSITVIGTAAQHARFGAFIRLIDGESELQRVYTLPEGRLDALTELMALSSVPVLVRPENEGLRVWGSELDHGVFAGFMALLGGEGEGGIIVLGQNAHSEPREHAEHEEHEEHEEHDDCTVSRADAIAHRDAQRAARDEARRHQAVAQRIQQVEREVVREVQQVERKVAQVMQKAAQYEQKAAQYEQKAAQIEQKAAVYEHESTSVEARADQYEDRADVIEEQADEIEEHAEDLEGAEAEELHAHAEKLRAEAEELREQADELREKADEILEKADEVREQADEVRDRADELRDKADEVRDQADELHERIEEIHEEREDAMAELHEELASSGR